MEKKGIENVGVVVNELVDAFHRAYTKAPISAADFGIAVVSFVKLGIYGYGIPEEKRGEYIDYLCELLEHERKS